MNQLLQNKLDNLPEQPGVYLMKDGDGSIIYIGKAKVLKNRVRQYFQSPSGHAIKVRKMVERIRDIDYYVTDSEVEALMLECNLIKQHRPYYNILMKDDKSYPYLMLTTSENYPRLILTRKRKLDGNKYFGPYVNAYAARQTLEAINQTYRLKRCNKQISYGTPSGRVCLQYHMDNCRGICRGDVREADYRNAIDEVEQILTNRPELLIHRLRQEMQEESEQLHFEAAAAIRDRIEAVQALHTEQKISNPSFDERDILALAAEDSEACIQLFQIRNGKITRTETKELRIDGEEPSEILSSFLEQYYTSGAYIRTKFWFRSFPRKRN
jgi:excinuclease ABC subunit C